MERVKAGKGKYIFHPMWNLNLTIYMLSYGYMHICVCVCMNDMKSEEVEKGYHRKWGAKGNGQMNLHAKYKVI